MRSTAQVSTYQKVRLGNSKFLGWWGSSGRLGSDSFKLFAAIFVSITKHKQKWWSAVRAGYVQLSLFIGLLEIAIAENCFKGTLKRGPVETGPTIPAAMALHSTYSCPGCRQTERVVVMVVLHGDCIIHVGTWENKLSHCVVGYSNFRARSLQHVVLNEPGSWMHTQLVSTMRGMAQICIPSVTPPNSIKLYKRQTLTTWYGFSCQLYIAQ